MSDGLVMSREEAIEELREQVRGLAQCQRDLMGIESMTEEELLRRVRRLKPAQPTKSYLQTFEYKHILM